MYGSEPPTSMYAPPVQSINQPTTMANPQNLTGSSHPGSVPRPNITANSPIYPHNQDHMEGLHSYGRWTIKARVTAKAELRHYNNAKGDGKVFSFDLLDATGGEVRITCFNAVADQFYDQIEAGKVYDLPILQESLASAVMNRIEDVLYADRVAQDPSLLAKKRKMSSRVPLEESNSQNIRSNSYRVNYIDDTIRFYGVEWRARDN
ncbi:replication protein A 70 kDa DNA-binding subunit A-like protein [Tanacetum coccineum]|uniref:Replication protein A 70 kDa DNA-binding subunit A-like protein n=1 Tax=Tanacetum coccineum TaxID=301880 RepID=A0ABQ5GEY1_9ASTR